MRCRFGESCPQHYGGRGEKLLRSHGKMWRTELYDRAVSNTYIYETRGKATLARDSKEKKERKLERWLLGDLRKEKNQVNSALEAYF